MKISNKEFQMLSVFIRENFGVNLSEAKKGLVVSRMANVLRELDMDSFSEYFEYLAAASNTDPVAELINKITTNHTYFYRENKHFEFLKEVVLPERAPKSGKTSLRMWSAGCSVGAEPYSMAMVIADYFGTRYYDRNVKILATDISSNVLKMAEGGNYHEGYMQDIPSRWKKIYFKNCGEECYTVNDLIKREIVFKRFNLLSRFPFKDKFDVIFCRNVMIYFQEDLKRALVDKFYHALKPGGYLFIGHSEVIDKNATMLRYIKPAIYRKD